MTAIDIIDVIIGFISIYIMFSLRAKLGGRVGGILNVVIWGVLFNTLALLWSFVFDLGLLPSFIPDIDLHHLFMTIGMILFVVATKKFFSLSQG